MFGIFPLGREITAIPHKWAQRFDRNFGDHFSNRERAELREENYCGDLDRTLILCIKNSRINKTLMHRNMQREEEWDKWKSERFR